MRPDDVDAFRQGLRLARRLTGMPLVFGGQVNGPALRLSEFLGTHTDSMHGLVVVPGRGLGGHVMQHQRPYAVNDYVPATTITHDYDNAVLAEGIRAIVAAPVAVRGTVRGVLYAAVRDRQPLGDRATVGLDEAARRLTSELAIRDEVDRRVQLLEVAAQPAEPQSPSLDELRQLHAELRGIVHDIDDADVRDRLRRACDRFGGLGAAPAEPPSCEPVPRLSARELDVLSYVALDCTNAETASRLCLRPETVKAYLRSAMRKLGVHTRREAIVAARRLGLLP